jgi:hypothetical protein
MASSTVGSVQLYDILPPGDTGGTTCPRMPVGVLTNSPSLGQEATLKVIGFTKAIANVGGCPLQNGSFLTASNLGQFRSASDDESDQVLGIWFGENVTSGSAVGNVLLNMSFTASGYQMLATNN